MKARIKWKEDPFRIIEQLDKGLRNKAYRIAMNKGASPVKAEVVTGAPQRYGFLKKSFRIKLVNYKQKTVWVAVVGPKSNFVRTKGKYKRGENAGKPIRHRPSAYARLVDKGTKHSRGQHFMEAALNSAGRRFAASVIAELKEQVASLLPKKRN